MPPLLVGSPFLSFTINQSYTAFSLIPKEKRDHDAFPPKQTQFTNLAIDSLRRLESSLIHLSQSGFLVVNSLKLFVWVHVLYMLCIENTLMYTPVCSLTQTKLHLCVRTKEQVWYKHEHEKYTAGSFDARFSILTSFLPKWWISSMHVCLHVLIYVCVRICI